MDVSALRTAVSGSVVVAEDAGWDAARLSHAGLGSPDVIVQAASVDDVRAAVRFAALRDAPIVVRGGGHSAWSTLDGGVLIDLSGLAAVGVDGADEHRIAHIGGGAVWGDVARVLTPLGLGISSGDTVSVGVGGLTLGGGIGWMVRAWGLASDQLVGAQVVTAAGEVVEVADAEHPDVFWALRGGGGNSGVVTRLDFTAHELPGVAYAEFDVMGDARPVLRALRELLAGAPRELTVTYMDVPSMDPSAPAGKTITACWAAPDADALRAALVPLSAIEGVVERALAVRPYPDILLEQPAADPNAPMPGFIGGNSLVVDVDDDVIDRLVAFREGNEASVLFLRSLGGAYGDVAADATPFPARDASWFVMAGAFDIPGLIDDASRARIAADWDAIEQRGAGVYGNFTTTTDAAFVRRMYSPEALTRLASIKREWDPHNRFARNHNVMPV